jgi:hypothetical protein
MPFTHYLLGQKENIKSPPNKKLSYHDSRKTATKGD